LTAQPTYGVVNGHPVHAHTRDHLPTVVKFSPKEIKHAVSRAEGFNAKVAVLITSGVGTMACAYLFCVIALVSLPEILIQANVLTGGDVPHFLNNQGLILIVAWIAQTFIQLVLLSIIMVGQRVQSAASDARAAKTFEDGEKTIDLLDIHTAGGIADLKAHIDDKFAELTAAKQ
jgi:hypothetical protein